MHSHLKDALAPQPPCKSNPVECPILVCSVPLESFLLMSAQRQMATHGAEVFGAGLIIDRLCGTRLPGSVWCLAASVKRILTWNARLKYGQGVQIIFRLIAESFG